MHTSLSKKLLAGLLSLVMVLSLVAPSMSTEAASKYSLTKKTSLTATSGVATTYYVKGVSKTQYIKVTGKASGVVVKYGSKTLKTTTKVNGTGKTLTLKVTAPDKNAVYTNKLVVKVYNKKTNKLVKTLTKSTKVYNKAKSITLSESEATLTVGDTLTLTATVDPAKGTRSQKWSTSDAAVATVEDGKVTAIAAGTATITLSIGSTTASATITVKEALKAEQTGAKKFTVTAGSDLTDAKISVSRGGNTVTSSVEANGKQAVVTLSANIMDEEYTITVNDEKVTVNGVVAKLDKIEVLGDYAVADKNTALPTTSATGKAIAAYAAYNQFGEDITKTTTVNVSCSIDSTVTANQGKVDIKLPNGTKEGDLVSLVIVEQTTGVNTTKVLKVSSKSAVAEVSFGELYNKYGYTLEEGSFGTYDYYQIVDLKDQYGNEITDASVYSEVLVNVAPGLTNLTVDTKFYTITVNGVDKLALKYKTVTGSTISAGTGSILLIAKSTGKSSQTSYTVAASAKLDTFTASPSEMVVGGEDVIFDFTAVDSFGKEVANPTASDFTTLPAGFSFVKNYKTGKTELHYTATSVAVDTPVYATFITDTNKVSTVSFTVKKDAYPVAISGFYKLSTGMLTTNSALLKASQVLFEDNYGRTMYAEDALTTINGVAYTLEAKTDDLADLTAKHGEVVADAISGGGVTVTTGTAISLPAANGIKVTSAATASAISFTLNLKAGINVVDSKTVGFESATMDSLKGFAVADIDLVKGYEGAADTDLTVTAQTPGGSSVTLAAGTDYTVVGAIASGSAINGSKLYVKDEAVSTKDGSFTVIIKNNEGTEVDKTMKVSNEDARPVAISLTTDTAKVNAKNVLTIANTTVVTNAELLSAIKVYDQYGDIYGTNPRIQVATKDANGNPVTVTGNGTSGAQIASSGVVANAEITVTYKYDNGLALTLNLGLSK